jgi:hypothetical protein
MSSFKLSRKIRISITDASDVGVPFCPATVTKRKQIGINIARDAPEV